MRAVSKSLYTQQFKAMRRLFIDSGPRNFEFRSSDENDTRARKPFSKLRHHTNVRTLSRDRFYALLQGGSSMASGRD
ncbi:hypothetical protein TNCV_1392741 [Trichonephila clavipes]|nr:hypothetical protein TNCV_1392741 [Trichonephila clavipes]